MGPSQRAIAVLLLAAVGCAGSGSSGGLPDADPNRPDARIPTCDTSSATIGRCELAAGGDCTGVPDEQRVFVPLAPGDSVPMVIGPQASLMFVLALQTTGIYAGDPDNPASPDNPNVEMTLLLDSTQRMAHYRGRPAFTVVPGNPDLLGTPGLFVVVEGSASELERRQITVVAELTDKDSVERCGTIMFVAEE